MGGSDVKRPIPVLEGVRGLLLDLDGVFYVGDVPLPGQAGAIDAFRALGLAVRVVTNTTVISRAMLLERLERLGVPVSPDEVFTPAALARRVMEDSGGVRYRLLGAPEIAGDLGPERLLPADDGHPDWVVLGLHEPSLHPDALTTALRDLLGGARLLALHANRIWKTPGGIRPGLGAWVRALEYAANVQALVVGKPSAAFFGTALADLGLAAAEVLMVGDDAETDVGGAQRVGMRGVLVLTGKTDTDRLRRSGVRPDLVVEDVAELARRMCGG